MRHRCKCFVLSIIVISLSIKCAVTNAFTDINDIVIFENCDVQDLRNIRANHTQPKGLKISHCLLHEIPNALFIRFPNLISLEIFESGLSNIQDFALNGLKNLQVINFSKNNLTFIKSWSDHDLQSLLTLDLRRNHITKIHKDGLDKYPNLTRLTLFDNLIDDVPEYTFKSNPNLKYINLGKNLITSVHDHTFRGLHKLTYLALHQNTINYIDYFAFVSITHLKTLRLEHNQLTAIEPELMTNLPRLSFLNISHNSLEYFIDLTFKKNIEIKVLDISWNNLNDFNTVTFQGLEMLEIFNISHNSIDYIDKYLFNDFLNLKHMDFSNNNLSILSHNLFEFLPNLERLNFSRNSIQHIDNELFANLLFLTKLDLSHNQLDTDNFIDLTSNNLVYLNLSGNYFKEMDTSKLYGLIEVQLEDNPWGCRWLIEQMAEKDPKLQFGKSYVVEHVNSALDAIGITCYDDNNEVRNLILLQPPQSELPYLTSEVDLSESRYEKPSKSIDDDFDIKSAILWLALGIIVVFGMAKICRTLLKKSEKKTEDWRRSQQVSKITRAYLFEAGSDMSGYYAV